MPLTRRRAAGYRVVFKAVQRFQGQNRPRPSGLLDSFLRHTTVTGAEFKRIMENGYRGGPESHGYFPQVSGFRVCVDRSRNEFDRIVSLQVPVDDGWQEIEADREYTLVVPDFLYGGGGVSSAGVIAVRIGAL